MRSTFPAVAALLLVASSAANASTEGKTTHVVEAGETLNGIANRAGVPRDAIIRANGLKPPYVIRLGQTLTIPRNGASATKAAARTIPARKNFVSLAQASEYVVQSGDTLGGIAARAAIPRILIAEANRLVPPYDIRIGQKLMLPRTRRHTVAPGDTGFAIAYEYAVPWEQIAIANGLDADGALPAGKELLIPTVINQPAATSAQTATSSRGPAASRFAWPLSGPVRRSFAARGSSTYHDGLDITAPRGTAVRAIGAGKVIFARKDPDQFGNLVVIDHGDGWHSAYASLGRITVKQGETVTSGERVGLVGDTSITRKTELHFELRKNGNPVDPLEHLPRQP